MSRVATAELWQLDRVIGGALIFVAVKEWLASLMFVFCHILRMCRVSSNKRLVQIMQGRLILGLNISPRDSHVPKSRLEKPMVDIK